MGKTKGMTKISPKFRTYKIAKLADLVNYEHNSRTHAEDQIKEVMDSIHNFGFTNPILVDGNNVLIAGHCRVEAAKRCGFDELPCIVIDDLNEVQRAALVIADNKLALNAGWDYDKLWHQISFLRDNGFNTDLTGFKPDEIDTFRPDIIPSFDGDEDSVPEVPIEATTKLGDIWVLGNHRLMCGDSVSPTDIERLTLTEKMDMLFTDPPYGMNYSGRGEKTSNKILNDNIDPTEFYNLLPEITERYIWGRVENYAHLLVKPRDVIIWKKNNFGMGNGYRGQYEVCFYYGDFKGSDSDVWEVDKDISYEHPTQKPVALAERAIKNSKPKNVIDLFGGSGSTLIACEKTNRKCYMMELSPNYCDVIVKRWEKLTGKKAELESNYVT